MIRHFIKGMQLCMLAIPCCASVLGAERKAAIICKVANMPQQMVILEMIDIDSIICVDSAYVNDDGKCSFTRALQVPGLYRLRFPGQRFILLSTDGGTISVDADQQDLSTYSITMGASSKDLRGFINGIRDLLRDMNTMTIVIDTLTARRDVRLEKAKAEFDQIKSGFITYVKKYANTTLYAPNPVFAVKMLRPEEEHEFLAKFGAALSKRFPDTKIVKDYLYARAR